MIKTILLPYRYIALILPILLIYPHTAFAEIVTVNIEAIVDEVDIISDIPPNPLKGKIFPGDSIVGSYTYDTLTEDIRPLDNIRNTYKLTKPANIKIEVGGIKFQNDQNNFDEFTLHIQNDDINPLAPQRRRDSYILESRNNISDFQEIAVEHISLELYDNTGDAISTPDLTANPPNVKDWRDRQLDIRVCSITEFDEISCSNNQIRIFATVTNIEKDIPEVDFTISKEDALVGEDVTFNIVTD